MDIFKAKGPLSSVTDLSSSWKIMIVIGVFLALFGIVFTLQGYRIVGPSSSFMYNSQTWVYTGAGIAIVGLVIFLGGVVLLSSDVKKSKKTTPPSASLSNT